MRASPQSRLWIEGDSTLHRYKSEASDLRIEITESSDAQHLPGLREGRITALTVRVGVRGLRSGEPSLDENLVSALKASEIVFRMDSYTVTGDLRLNGRLTIAGQERPVELSARMTPVPGGTRVTGSKELLMSQFGVKPPTLMLGVIRVKDLVSVHFDIILEDAPR